MSDLLQDSSLSAKQTEQLNSCLQVITNYGVKIYVDKSWPEVSEPVIFDVEHDETSEFVCCGFFIPSLNSVYVYFDFQLLRSIPISSLRLIAHNGRTDISILRIWGFEVRNENLVWDTELVGHVLDSSQHSYGLKNMADRDLDIHYPSYDDIVGKRGLKTPRVTLNSQPRELVTAYNACDCIATGKLYEKQNIRCLDSHKKYLRDIEIPTSYGLSAMEDRGICIDVVYLSGLRSNLELQKAPLIEVINNELGNINLNSPKQVLAALNLKGVYPVLKGKPSADKRALEYCKTVPVVNNLLRFSEVETLLTSFVYPYLKRGQSVLHPFFNQCGTRTGRLSCSNPNLLQIPKRTENGRLLRRMFVPRSGMQFGDCDYSSIEPRLLAHLSQDDALLRLFIQGTDFHDYFAERIKVDRHTAKVFDLQVYYRATEWGVDRLLKCGLTQAQKYIAEAWELFPGLRRWEEKILFDARKSGTVTTLMGRRIKVEDVAHGNRFRREAAERQAINNLIQGSAAEVMKLGMNKVVNDKRLSPNYGLLVQVYDELLAESDQMEDDINFMKEDMEQAIALRVPLVVKAKTGANWADVE